MECNVPRVFPSYDGSASRESRRCLFFLKFRTDLQSDLRRTFTIFRECAHYASRDADLHPSLDLSTGTQCPIGLGSNLVPGGHHSRPGRLFNGSELDSWFSSSFQVEPTQPSGHGGICEQYGGNDNQPRRHAGHLVEHQGTSGQPFGTGQSQTLHLGQVILPV